MKSGVKVSGLIAAGKVAAAHGVAESTKFDAPGGSAPSSNEVGVEQMIDIALMDDSPYQIRKKYDPVHVDELSNSMLDAGQRSPVTVRIVRPGRYEIIKGHTRKYAAKNIGWTQLRTLIVERSDRDAKLDCMVDNEGRPPTEWEYASMYREAMADNYAATQVEVARLFVCSQAKVSNCLSMLELPKEVAAILDEAPALLGAKAGKVVAALWTNHPAHHDLILEAIDRVRLGAEQGSIKGWVAQKLVQHRPARDQRHIITSAAGVSRYVTKGHNRDINIRITDPSLDRDMVHRQIDELLRKLESDSDKENNQ